MKSTEACLVCGESNSSVGWHCGTITCEACKKFFQRNNEDKIEEKDQKCIRGTNNCVITVSTRTSCSFCRYQKCIQVGMKSNGELEKIPTHTVDFKHLPCRVCSDASSGVHFGEITCEGCKGFFRRNANSVGKFVCVGDGKCEINVPNRNVCKACRLDKCIQIGMSLKKSKIGRQSNLFKQKLKHHVNMSKTGNLQSIVSNDQIKPEHILPQSLQLPTILNSNIEDKLDQSTSSLVKLIFSSYVRAFEVSSAQYFPYNDRYLENFREHNMVCKFINGLMNRCIAFLDKIPGFQTLDKSIKLKLVSNGLHSIRLLQMANNVTNINYLNLDQKAYEEVTERFPVFKEKMVYFESYKQFIQNFKLDAKEIALYSALIIFSSVGQELSMMKHCYGLNMNICRTLTAYMVARRNETESAEMLIQNSFRFERLNTHLQLGIFEKFEELEKYGFLPLTLCHFIIYNPFKITNLNINMVNI